MAADKHFHPPAPVPDALEDHKPDDMPAARSLIVIIGGLLVVCAIIAAVIYGRANPDENTLHRQDVEQAP